MSVVVQSEQSFAVSNISGCVLRGLIKVLPSERRTIVLCHGLGSSKEKPLLKILSNRLPFTVARFDFAGNGSSDGEFSFANYYDEVEDLRAVVNYLETERLLNIVGLVGHSKGADVVLLYSVKYGNANQKIVSLAARYDLRRGLEKYGGFEEIEKKGAVTAKSGFTITREDVQRRLSVDMSQVERINGPVLCVHGDADKTIPVEDAHTFGKRIGGSVVKIVHGGDHPFTGREAELCQVVSSFLTGNEANFK